MSTRQHNFHIPVMGIGFTIDSPLKVAVYGIDSSISLVDDMLIEKMRKHYCHKYNLVYNEISEKIEDFRAKRITSYLDMMNNVIDNKINQLRNCSEETVEELKNYFGMIPAKKDEFSKKISGAHCSSEVKEWVRQNIQKGSIDVNIMTKVDKDNYVGKEKLPVIYNDAHAALRGFAESTVQGSLVLSAGLNPRLYGYIASFEDFYPKSRNLKKKVVLKVSDYRSALIQGKFLVKKGVWVSEFRVESGLNCGGHAFATEGNLLGPILESFKVNKTKLIVELHDIYIKALTAKNIEPPTVPLPVKITAQGGVGTHEEHEFLLNYYQLESVGWGSPFLLVPEATTVDDETLHKLVRAKEEDLYLSNVSPLGVPFNNLRGNTKDEERQELIKKGRPGSSCPKKYVSLNKEFTEKSICVASRQYQHLKIAELQKGKLSTEVYQKEFKEIVEKSCICVGLGTSALLANKMDVKSEGKGVSVCPGPNIAYFARVTKLEEMVKHIYGKTSVISRQDRPNMFIKELKLYTDYFKERVYEVLPAMDEKEEKRLMRFSNNLLEGIEYYQNLFSGCKTVLNEKATGVYAELKNVECTLKDLQRELNAGKQLM
ncbi:hypothetical protein HX109_07070 [Galbibacter sp. BG1]|uniref:hypothetical protein n=1 Tax=Galbibacter sp. BG1 TaxID=1170699 RepID=UPI0015BE3A6E|nr:hypothetical protein [Galbibacter sp. BG1]QLE01338.1 hypothetical protein HX109_07070 [Galbibacter sp. BG1]